MAKNSALKLAIFDSRWSQIELAKKAGIHETRLSKIINGHVDAHGDEQRELAKLLRRPVEALFPMEAKAS